MTTLINKIVLNMEMKNMRKIYYTVSDDSGEPSGVQMLSGIMQWIAAAIELADDLDDLPTFTITPVAMTEKEFKNLPEEN